MKQRRILSSGIETGPGYGSLCRSSEERAGIPTTPWVQHRTAGQEILANGRADFVALGRELLRNPYWVLEAKKEQELWPEQYHRALPTD